jgi:hypothetical protein
MMTLWKWAAETGHCTKKSAAGRPQHACHADYNVTRNPSTKASGQNRMRPLHIVNSQLGLHAGAIWLSGSDTEECIDCQGPPHAEK